ncbi:putative transcription factor C2H2 family [Helianthus annuus]|uniref:Putative E3 ubiquitin-protein ligase BOI n=1 Tax=Helianthus annuus TaxID=4232 RepID=A0A251TB49_HELAN|nr:probable BOI-related E3 ubiquitin-protein ligase 3 [Helianthus annuus]KAF5781407.1 putative transcription factor C2H2 family [Helianthus annuus]KAJ0501022.1 putative transcription factor C2H2 family [Helianthus annuus]KAJ0508696.1 putative transcription factor C2H2 family [Helianthus annuus]KAJ0516911.1 putative transcription factor C2H2 family [Helianthus annuus]KAJ0684921.1 putative transcription factor C2H2 family [Helianthus annuus]
MISNREMIDHGNINVYGNELKFDYGMNQMENGVIPMPMYVPSELTDAISKKRSRDLCSFDPSVSSFPIGQFVNQNDMNTNMNNQKAIITFLGQDISMHIYEQQLEIDRFISQHTEKMRSEIEASRRRITMRLLAVADEGMKQLRSKEDEIVKIGRLNQALEQKVKSLNVDNQIWQQMAQTNEATANVLRRNLQQLLTEIQQQQRNQLHAVKTGDVQSCCGSNEEDGRTLVGGGDVEAYCNNGGRWCRNCGKEELCVLLLPCRHLCICTVCESSINVCPICKSTKNATVHVNMNSF